MPHFRRGCSTRKLKAFVICRQLSTAVRSSIAFGCNGRGARLTALAVTLICRCGRGCILAQFPFSRSRGERGTKGRDHETKCVCVCAANKTDTKVRPRPLAGTKHIGTQGQKPLTWICVQVRPCWQVQPGAFYPLTPQTDRDSRKRKAVAGESSRYRGQGTGISRRYGVHPQIELQVRAAGTSQRGGPSGFSYTDFQPRTRTQREKLIVRWESHRSRLFHN